MTGENTALRDGVSRWLKESGVDEGFAIAQLVASKNAPEGAKGLNDLVAGPLAMLAHAGVQAIIEARWRKTGGTVAKRRTLPVMALLVVLGVVGFLPARGATCSNAFQRAMVPGMDVTYRDSSGRITADAHRTGSQTVFRDPTGRIVQNVSESDHSQTFRDSSGRIIGEAYRVGDTVTYRDSTGRMTGTASTSGKNTTFRDSSGRVTCTSSTMGNQTTVRDATGRIIESSTSRPDPFAKTNAPTASRR